MLTDNLIIALNRFVTDFSKVEEGSLSFAPEVYQRQLDEYYDGMTKTIISDINRDIDWLSKEDNEYLKNGYREQIPIVKGHIAELSLSLKDVSSFSTYEDYQKTEMRIAFCEKVQFFIECLLKKIDEASSDALTNNQISGCHFERLKPHITEEHLRQIYAHLLAEHWICSRCTDFSDFRYYFTGNGFKPMEPIHWKMSIAKLTLFLDELVDDENIWVKASYIFLVKNKPVSRKVLGNTHSKSLDCSITVKHLKELKTKIMHVELPDIPFWRTMD